MASIAGGSAETSPPSGPTRRGGNENHRGGVRGRGRGNANERGVVGRSERGRGRGGGGRGRRGADISTLTVPTVDQSTTPAPRPDSSLPKPHAQSSRGSDVEAEYLEAEVCFICASPVVHQSVAPCNHRTCHICALRMRALYKNKECAHCRTAAPFVMFTDDATKRYQDYSDQDVTSTDDNIGIRYTNEDIVGDTVLLLRYNCPDTSCDFAGLGWPDLHRHVRSAHHKKMCDLCMRNKKVFTHEHELFTDKELEKHMRHGDDQPGAVDQTGFRGHPLCAFCGQRFYDDDKLYEHCRSKHERCFICDREDPRQPHYYRDYNALEEHFKNDHFLCIDRECLEKKFVVFGSEMDLKAHQLSEHAGSLSKDLRRDARVVDLAGFDVRERYQQQRRGGGRGRDGNREGEGNGRTRGRDPNAEPLPVSSAQPLRRDELAYQRQMAIHSSQSVSNRSFGGQLSSSAPSPSGQSSQRATGAGAPAPTATAAPVTEMDGLSLADPNLSPEDRIRLMRHSAVIERASNLLRNDKAKIDIFRSQISSYRRDKVSAAALVDTLFSLFSDTSSAALGTLFREMADLFDDKAKGDRLRKAWNDWRAINEDYPTLPGLGGMHGATTSNSGWAAAAASSPLAAATAPSQKHTTRVLKLKNSTQQSQRSSVVSASAVFATRAASRPNPPPAASFPSLPSSSGPLSRPSSTALWGTTTRPQASVRPPATGNREDAFPALPVAPKPTTTIFGYGTGRGVRRDNGGRGNTGFSWGSTSEEPPTASGVTEEEEEGGGEGGGKGKKGNKGRKKVLVQWG
ncbi:Uu.00g036670.m01.CDS01 [Anthostomella pinea]|uniref:RING-type E3 ubiquitin transferase n=1 Tax=Anthostomella pinea TaxID=933095 RepID=A0AAI8V9C4_9PEZI|nr:Uu.00g036670.m01.CDS01 [Anthostomella pinea]